MTKVEIVKDTDINKLKEEVNLLISDSEYRLKDFKITVHNCIDYYDNGAICNQWFEYIAVIIFEL